MASHDNVEDGPVLAFFARVSSFERFPGLALFPSLLAAMSFVVRFEPPKSPPRARIFAARDPSFGSVV
jgi:hypothetical protein